MSNELILASKGVFGADIALPRNPDATEEFAADELRRHLCQMVGAAPLHSHYPTGRRPCIYINDHAAAAAAGIEAASLPPEGFRIVTAGHCVFILGGTPRGALYGVYELLESLGCRWYSPTVTHVP